MKIVSAATTRECEATITWVSCAYGRPSGARQISVSKVAAGAFDAVVVLDREHDTVDPHAMLASGQRRLDPPSTLLKFAPFDPPSFFAVRAMHPSASLKAEKVV